MSGDDLRSRYETAVSGLRAQVIAMREASTAAEEIAHVVHAERRRLTGQFKQQTPEPLRSLIHRRTLAVYGDPIGPTIEYLRAMGKSWDDIIDSAIRPGPVPSFAAEESGLGDAIDPHLK